MASIDELWLFDFGNPYPGEQASHRPALVIGPPPMFGTGFPFVIVVPLTTTYRRLSLHIEVEPTPQTGLDRTSFIQCELIRSINRNRLVRRLGLVAPDTSHQVRRIVQTLLDH
ncbi:MAG: type II toxin-antitoxin system PemK/MazF family toxin [Acidimicrobiia bacterium]|nr:type II toxin-antitoxin system PemK/MazF family toxin [Acidimicrobiia bacterium]